MEMEGVSFYLPVKGSQKPNTQLRDLLTGTFD